MSQVVLVTGASGYLGSHIVSRLLEKGYNVKAAARGRKAEALRVLYVDNPSAEVVEISDIVHAQFEHALVGVDAVIHVASPQPGRADPQEMMEGALEGSLNVLRQAEKAGVKKFVVTSSTVAVVGDPTVKGTAFRAEHWSPVTKEDALRSNDKLAIYTASKKYAELAVWEWAEAHPHVDVTTILPCMNLGPFPSKCVPFPKPEFDTLSTALMLYNLLFPTGTYLPTVDYAGYIDIRDVARAHVGALESKPDKNARKRVIISSPYGLANKPVLDIIKKEHPELERRFITVPVPECPPVGIDADFERVEEVTGLRKEDFHTLEQTISDSVKDLLRLEDEWKRNGYTVTELPSFVHRYSTD